MPRASYFWWRIRKTYRRTGIKRMTFLVAIRLRETPVPIPNTMVKPEAADGTMRGTAWESRRLPDLRGRSSAGRAPALQAGGQEFESLRLHCSVKLQKPYLENRILKRYLFKKRVQKMHVLAWIERTSRKDRDIRGRAGA